MGFRRGKKCETGRPGCCPSCLGRAFQSRSCPATYSECRPHIASRRWSADPRDALTLTSQVANINLKVNNTENAIVCNVNGGVDLYHNNVKKLETESVGATLTGNLTVTGTVDGRDVAADGATLDALQGISAAWPVGSIYMNASNGTNPATLLGFGTWVAFGTGRVLVAIDTGQAEFNVLGETGGAKTHTLTTAELAAHTHGVLASDFPGGAGRLEVAGGSPESTQTSQSAGSGNAHNNLQPYITVHMFKRTA